MERIFLANSRLKIWRDFAIEIRQLDEEIVRKQNKGDKGSCYVGELTYQAHFGGYYSSKSIRNMSRDKALG